VLNLCQTVLTPYQPILVFISAFVHISQPEFFVGVVVHIFITI